MLVPPLQVLFAVTVLNSVNCRNLLYGYKSKFHNSDFPVTAL